MAYIIYNNDNTVLLTLADGEIDTDTTALTLVGKNVNNYGQYVNNNFYYLIYLTLTSLYYKIVYLLLLLFSTLSFLLGLDG